MSFGKSFFASLLAFLVGSVLLVFLFFIVITGIVAVMGNPDPVEVKETTVLHLQLNKEIVENARVDEPEFDFGSTFPTGVPGLTVSSGKIGMYQILKNIGQAAEDERVKGIYLNLQGAVPTGWANLSAIREALVEFKGSGKFIYAYSELYSENSYYLASVADSIFMPQEGIFEHNGFGGVPMFYKGLFDKLELEPRVFKVGTFKSATEQYTETKMSEASRLQTEAYINEFWGKYRDAVAESRGLAPTKIDELASTFLMGNADQAKAAGFIDKVAVSSDMRPALNRALGEEDLLEDIPFLSFKKYLQATKGSVPSSRNRIAVVFAEGTMVPGKSSDGVMGSTTIVQELRKSRLDKKVKAGCIACQQWRRSHLSSRCHQRRNRKATGLGKTGHCFHG